MISISLKLATFIIFICSTIYAQNNFIYCRNNKFFLGENEFYFLGVGVYYLQWMASDSSTKHIVGDVFQISKQTGIKVVRTWGFNSNSDSTINSNIRYHPYILRESGLRALDYVIYMAGLYDTKIVLTLENNFDDFGGIKQYIEWANEELKPWTDKTYQHTDFFTDDSIKSWYKYYVKSILTRVNSYTLKRYTEDDTILSFELINEASNPGFEFTIIKHWYQEMAEYFKSIDQNHLLTTGEIGFDITTAPYSDPDFFYNSSFFLFNGRKGTSYIENSILDQIDYASYHLYPDGWGLSSLSGNTWINDHTAIAHTFDKPALVGEFGVIQEKENKYKTYFETIRNTPSKSAIIWNYVHPDLMNIADKYAFNELQNPDIFKLFREHIQFLARDTLTRKENDYLLFQNYPNPFNPSTTIKYSINIDEYVKIELFDCLGQLISVIEQGEKNAGTYILFLSFDNYLLSSGIYFYRLQAGKFVQTKKMVLMK